MKEEEPTKTPGHAGDIPSSFARKWIGVRQDVNPFVILNLKVNGADLAGDVSIANMSGDKNGQCVAVTDRTGPEHAMTTRGAALMSGVLSFRVLSGTQFTMALDDAKTAQLRFLNTPVENSPWRLKKNAGESS